MVQSLAHYQLDQVGRPGLLGLGVRVEVEWLSRLLVKVAMLFEKGVGDPEEAASPPQGSSLHSEECW